MRCPTIHILGLVRGQLAEARRYTHSDPRAAAHLFEMAIPNFALACRQLDRRHLDHARIVENLIVGQRCMDAAPDVTDAYLAGAIWEIGDLASQLRKEEEAEGRDAELLDAYGPKENDTTRGGATDGTDH